MNESLILASTSSSRRAMLTAAGLTFEAISPGVDEAAIKHAMPGTTGATLADALAQTKALQVSRRRDAALVLGADQVLETEDGTLFDKPATLDEAMDHLHRLSGKTHTLISAAVVAQGGHPVWRATTQARLTMRALSDAFIANYFAQEGEAILSSVGCYRIEGRGAQLFERIEGDHFTIMGLPLLPLLQFLRLREFIPS